MLPRRLDSVAPMRAHLRINSSDTRGHQRAGPLPALNVEACRRTHCSFRVCRAPDPQIGVQDEDEEEKAVRFGALQSTPIGVQDEDEDEEEEEAQTFF